MNKGHIQDEEVAMVSVSDLSPSWERKIFSFLLKTCAPRACGPLSMHIHVRRYSEVWLVVYGSGTFRSHSPAISPCQSIIFFSEWNSHGLNVRSMGSYLQLSLEW